MTRAPLTIDLVDAEGRVLPGAGVELRVRDTHEPADATLDEAGTLPAPGRVIGDGQVLLWLPQGRYEWRGVSPTGVTLGWVPFDIGGAGGGVGPQGAPGAPGADGAPGPAGEQGPLGAQGPEGTPGPIGPEGPAGPLGNQGAQGPAGADGRTFNFRGAWDAAAAYARDEVVHYQGSAWIALAASTGAAPAADSAEWDELALAGAAGPQGPEGPAGLAGALGDPGAQGAVGPQGPQGIQGPAGADGAAGPAGPAGPTLGVAAYVQQAQPASADPYLWIETDADGAPASLWVNT